MPKSRSSKASRTYEWINASIELPPVGVRPSRAGNNDTGAKGKLKCAGCRMSKIKCVYNESRTPADVSCTNCLRRGISCGVKLPGPKSQVDATAIDSRQDRISDGMKEYMRLFRRFQRLRPRDGPDEIAKLVELVQNGTLKEEGDTFVIRNCGDDAEVDGVDVPLSDYHECGSWGPSSHNMPKIQLSGFEGPYFGAPASDGQGNVKTECRDYPLTPRTYIPVPTKSPISWLQSLNGQPCFRYLLWLPIFARFLTNSELDHALGFANAFPEDVGVGKYF